MSITNKYLNNLIEQDHRAIKRRCASMAGFKSCANAAITIAGVELAHRIRKRQFSFGRPSPPQLVAKGRMGNGTRIRAEARNIAGFSTTKISHDAPETDQSTPPRSDTSEKNAPAPQFFAGGKRAQRGRGER